MQRCKGSLKQPCIRLKPYSSSWISSKKKHLGEYKLLSRCAQILQLSFELTLWEMLVLVLSMVTSLGS